MAESKKIQKKNFFEVKVPMTSARVSLYSVSPDNLIGRIITLDLTRSLRGKSLELKARVQKEGEELVGNPVSIELIGSYVRRMMRNGIDYVEDSFIGECKNTKVIIKPFMITRNKVSRAVRKNLRNLAREHLQGILKSRTSSEIFSEITTNKIQKELSLKLKRVYPLALCEIRVFKILQEKK